ncbi:MAG: hypothetical protein IPH93_08640 [Saprospiraceae bacterium]|nr:hypothetical protein [Saprospiraceae bacterium]MBK7810564.1 hypothetical protein [Saprospiraceae bacterium]MBK9630155.1 hypothetical protein [Saprospiraceae bacterium]
MPAYIIILCIAALVALDAKLKNRESIPYFFWFLLICCIVEVGLGPYLAKKFGTNTLLYNIYTIFTFCYYSCLFIKKNPRLHWSHPITYLGIILLLASFINLLFFQGFNILNTTTYNLGMLYVSYLIGLYFIELIRDEVFYNLTDLPLFWLSIGIISFYTSSFPILFYLDDITQLGGNLTKPLFSLITLGNSFLSLSYIAVTLCKLWVKS